MADNYILVGRQKGTTKAGKVFYNYFFNRPFTNYESENGECLGMSVSTEFSYEDFPCLPGDTVALSYGRGFQDKAVLTDIRVVKSRHEEKVPK